MDAYIHDVFSADKAGGEGSVVVQFSGCDFRCAYCDAKGLLEFQTGEQRDLREVKAAIDAEAPRRVIFTGGEPLLQRQALLELLQHCRTRGYRSVVETNASKPAAVKSILPLTDELRVDLKAPLARFDKVTRAGTFFKPASAIYADIEESIQLIKTSFTGALSFSTVVVPGLLYSKEDFLALAALLEGCKAEWLLIPFRPEDALDHTLRGVAPPTTRFLETLAGFIKKAHPQLEVKIGEQRRLRRAQQEL